MPKLVGIVMKATAVVDEAMLGTSVVDTPHLRAFDVRPIVREVSKEVRRLPYRSDQVMRTQLLETQIGGCYGRDGVGARVTVP